VIQEKREDAVGGQSGVSRQMAQESDRSSVPSENKSIGRNDPCYCGSGKKFKKCHGK